MFLRFLTIFATCVGFAGDFGQIPADQLQNVHAKYIGHMTQDLAGLAQFSKNHGELIHVQTNSVTQTPRFITGQLTSPSSRDALSIATEFLQLRRESFKINSTIAFVPLPVERDSLGMTHIRFNLAIDGVPVWPAQVAVHLDHRGVIHTVNGVYRGDYQVHTKAKLSTEQAIEIAMAELGLDSQAKFETDLIIYDWQIDEPTLAYRVKVHHPSDILFHRDLFIDAHSGVLINQIDQVCTGLPVFENNFKEAVNCTVFPNRTDNQSATVSGWRDSNQIFLINSSKPMFPGQLDPNTLAGTIYLLECLHTNQPQGLSIDPNADASFNDNNDTKAAGAAAYNMSRTYDWLLNTFNRNSFDGKGSALRMFVNFRQDPNQGLDNAFWNGQELVFGDGGMISYNWAFSLDFMTHEICHAITSSSANLVYQFQSGALNESFSDMYGVTQDDDDWLMGDTIIKQEVYISPGLRDLSNPNQAVQAGDYFHGWQPAHMNEYQNLTAAQDNGGVHINSGIPNFAYFKLASAIGRAKAIQIMHRTLTMYLTRNSEFTDFRAAAEKAAADLHGAGSAEQNAVSTACAAVGIGAGTLSAAGRQLRHHALLPLCGTFQLLQSGLQRHLHRIQRYR